jgi:hypothetical protein
VVIDAQATKTMTTIELLMNYKITISFYHTDVKATQTAAKSSKFSNHKEPKNRSPGIESCSILMGGRCWTKLEPPSPLFWSTNHQWGQWFSKELPTQNDNFDCLNRQVTLALPFDFRFSSLIPVPDLCQPILFSPTPVT